jgi:hypothetical protein
VVSVDYDEEKRELWVRFKKGGVYVYHEVGRGVADGFAQSIVSADRYFRSSVLNQYQFERMQ